MLVRGWPQASHDYVSRPGLASGESWLPLPLEVFLGRDVTTSPAWACLWQVVTVSPT
jgi:hypothetical protein